MNNSQFPDLESRLNKLGQDLSEHSSVISNVMNSIHDNDPSTAGENSRVALSDDATPTFSDERRPSKSNHILRRLSLALGMAGVLAVGVVLTRPQSVYAKAIAALNKVQSIRITGWSSEVRREWPLEEPSAETGTKRHQVDMWFWREVDGTSRSYEQCGPVTKVMKGRTQQEYQSDVDLLYLAEGISNDDAQEILTLEQFLAELKRDAKKLLGTKSVKGKELHGVQLERNGRIDEYWFDVSTDLPIRYSRTDSEGQTVLELHLTYDEAVPEVVASYAPPKAKNIRYGGQHPNAEIAWKQHVQNLWATTELPTDGWLATTRENKAFAQQWAAETPDKRHLVLPIDLGRIGAMDLSHFVRLRVIPQTGECLCGDCLNSQCNSAAWSIASDLSDFRFPKSDLVVSKQTFWRVWAAEFLAAHGLKLEEVQRERTVWIAKHDGRKLKRWQSIQPPVSYKYKNGKPLLGVLVHGRGKGINKGQGVTLRRLLQEFHLDQSDMLNGTGVLVEDKTGLAAAPARDFELYPNWKDWQKVESEFYVATDAPFFAREEGREMAREWFEDKLGVTFEEETRTITMFEISRK